MTRSESGGTTLAIGTPQQHQQARPAPQTTQVETVSIIIQARRLASARDSAQKEAREHAAEKTGGALKREKSTAEPPAAERKS
jgi:hypothetical protein